MPVRPPNAYPAGTKLTVGSHEVEIIDFIGAGGFAHVYTVHANPPVPNQAVTCLKRVQVPDKAYLNLLRAEVDAMQRLKGSSNIVQYFDSHAERMQPRDSSQPSSAGTSESDLNPVASNRSSQYEVFLLMEYCERGGLIDFMNTRLRDQLREHEILKIMYDITLGLSHMHYLRPPLLHRDLKIENVLISSDGEFKLCDFGSVSPVLRPPKTPQELKILEDDVQHHTTVQYRPPEMIDVGMGYPIDEKSDIWALGVFLYKLCYYTTPFERPNQTLEQFSQLILAGSFAIPPRPAYSDRLRNMVCVLLQPNPRMRPNVFQVMQEICSMRHMEVPIADIYRPVVNMVPNVSIVPQTAPVAPSHPVAKNIPIAGSNSSAPINNQLVNNHPVNNQLVNNQPINNQFVPGIPHQGAPNHPTAAPGQVSVPGVLLTSPAVPPHSPERSVSPVDDLSTRFPSLEELDRLAPAVSATPSHHEVRKLNTKLSMDALTTGQYPRKSSVPQLLPKETANLVDFSEDNPTKSPTHAVSAEAASLQKILHGISDRSSTVIMDKPAENSSLSSVDFLRTLRSSEAPATNSHHKSHHKSHLKSHLKSASRSSGLFAQKNGRSKYLDAGDDVDSNNDDSGEDYDASRSYDAARSYDADRPYDDSYIEPYDPEEVSDLSSEDEAPTLRRNIDEKKPAKPPLAAKPLKLARPLSDPDAIPPKPVKPVSPKPLKPSQFSRSVPDLDPENPSGKPVVRAAKPQRAATTLASPKSAALVSGKPSLAPVKPSLPNSVASSPTRSSVTVSSGNAASSENSFAGPPATKPKPTIMGQTIASTRAGELTAFKPTNSIQQRVHMFLNSQDHQHPPRKTATGYGRFTDAKAPSDSESTDDSVPHSANTMRRRSLGVLPTRKPKI